MRIETTGIVTNEYNDFLLIQAADSTSWQAPGGALRQGILPAQATAGWIKKQTGLAVIPVRLVSLVHKADRSGDGLSLIFRCLTKGGELAAGEGIGQAGFYRWPALPQPLGADQEEIIGEARTHRGGYPNQLTGQSSAGGFLSSLLAPFTSQNLAAEAPDWQVDIALLPTIDNQLWWQEGVAQELVLPMQQAVIGAPWQAAVDLAQSQGLKQITSVEIGGLFVDTQENRIIIAAVSPIAQAPSTGRWHSFPIAAPPAEATAEFTQLAVAAATEEAVIQPLQATD